MVNWAKIWDGASHGGGVNGYCQAIALELLARGHEVISLCGGTTYEPEPGTRRLGPCSLRRHPDWFGIRVFEVINSPVLAPAMAQFRDPLGEITSSTLEKEIHDLMQTLAPDVVHFHNIEGFSAGCISAIRRAAPSAVIFYTLHNYHTICPQVYLMQGHRRPCRNFNGGRNCTNCIPTIDPLEEKRRLAFGGPAPEFTWNQQEAEEDHAADGSSVRHLLRRVKKVAASVRAGQMPIPIAPEPASVPLNILNPEPMEGEDIRGQTKRLLLSQRPHPWCGADIPAWRPLLNTVEPEPPSDHPPNRYARRRKAMIDMLNACDGVLAVSGYVHHKFASLGVNQRHLRTLHIGSHMPDVVATRPEAVFAPPPIDPANPRPIRMAFAGYNNWYKGLPMLADSLELLTPEYLARIHLFVYALNGEEMEPRLRRLEPRLAALTMRHGYEIEELPWFISGMDLGLVTSVWWDNGPQTVMEFLACGVPLLAAELGGIPDFVRDGENGLLFRGNDRWDLARRIAEVVRNPGILAHLRAGVKPPKTMAQHAAELESLYSEPLSSEVM